MAAPHVAGAAALYVSNHTTATPAQVRDALVNGASLGRVISPGTGSPNRLLRVPRLAPPPPPPPPWGAVITGGFEDVPTGSTQSSSGGYELIEGQPGFRLAVLGGYNGARETIGQ